MSASDQDRLVLWDAIHPESRRLAECLATMTDDGLARPVLRVARSRSEPTTPRESTTQADLESLGAQADFFNVLTDIISHAQQVRADLSLTRAIRSQQPAEWEYGWAEVLARVSK